MMRSKFWSIYIGATAALIVVAAAALTLFGFALAAYERTRPERVLDHVLDALNASSAYGIDVYDTNAYGADAQVVSVSAGVLLNLRDGTVLPATPAALRSAVAASYAATSADATSADATSADGSSTAAAYASDDDVALLGEAVAAAFIPDGARWSYAAVPGEASVYAFDCDGRAVFTLTLDEAGRDFGYAVPAAGTAALAISPVDTPAASLLGSYTATLLVPRGASVVINGTARDFGDAVSAASTVPAASTVSATSTVSAARADVFGSERDEADVYTLTLYAGARVAVTLDGDTIAEGTVTRAADKSEYKNGGVDIDLAKGYLRALSRDCEDGTCGVTVDLARAYFDAMTADYAITAPSGARVAVGGVTLDGENCVIKPLKADTAAGYASGTYAAGTYAAGSYAAGSYAARVNAAAGGLTSYTVRSRDGGLAVAIDGVYAGALRDCAAPYDPRTVLIKAPSDALVYLNGVWLDPGDATVVVATGSVPKEIEGLDDYIGAEAPLTMTYKVAGLYAEPDVTATVGGAAAPVTAADGEYSVSPPDDAQLREARAADVTAFLDSYIAYTAGGRIDTEANFAAVIARVLPSSDAAKVLYASKFSFGQNIPYTVTAKKITLRDFRAYGDNCFAVSVDMTIDLKNFRAAQDKITDMRLVFVHQSDKWLLANFYPGK